MKTKSVKTEIEKECNKHYVGVHPMLHFINQLFLIEVVYKVIIPSKIFVNVNFYTMIERTTDEKHPYIAIK